MDAFRATDTPPQPACAWIWNAPIQMGEVKRRLDGMKRTGIRTVYILPDRGSLHMLFNESGEQTKTEVSFYEAGVRQSNRPKSV